MVDYAIYFAAAIIFFLVGLWVAFLDVLFAETIEEKEFRDARGISNFWALFSITVIGISILILNHVLFAGPLERAEKMQDSAFLNVPESKKKRAIDAVI